MSKPDADRAMDVYRNFTKQTDNVVQYLSVARQYEHHTRVEVPKLKHAPVNLGRQLEDYLNDTDFEIHRRQYLAELEAKKGKGGLGTVSKPFQTSDSPPKPAANNPFPSVNGAANPTSSKPASKGPDADLIDFFDSIEQNQTPLGAAPAPAPQGASPWGNSGFQPQPTGFQNGFATQQTGFQGTNPFQQQMTGFPQQQQQQAPPPQLQPAFTGAGFGGFTSQQSGFQSSLGSIPQDSVASFPTGAASMSNMQQQQQQQMTNPFRVSMMTGQPTGMQSAPTSPPSALQPQQTSTNPFARASPNGASQPFNAPPNSTAFPASPPQAAPLQPMATGTNPFAKGFGGAAAQQQQRPATSAGTLMPQPTGTTNPFRQSQFVNHNTGMGWQHQQQPMGGGLDNLQTIPVFPRPATQSPWQQ